jgi:hypothetical protein
MRVCATVARQDWSDHGWPKQPPPSARRVIVRGLARQLREIQRELAMIREELGSHLPTLTRRLAEDARLVERRQ